MRKWLFYVMMLAIWVTTGLYWAYVDKGKPSQESILVMVIAIGTVVTIRALTLGESPVDFSFNLKKKFQRIKRILFSK